MMSRKSIPVPPENRSPKGTGSNPPSPEPVVPEREEADTHDIDPDQQGQPANTRQNTRTQGSQGRRGR